MKFFRIFFIAVVTLLLPLTAWAAPPNVILLVTDDQGYGELSVHGNPVLKTPNLDKLHNQSVRFTDFHVAPMCTPTRGQLMTGLDAVRNGATNVSSGRSLMRTEFPTVANYFADAGYKTGIFGKWHLGDNYPYRPDDRGFQETLWFPSSHIGSVPDYWNNDYFDDVYFRNGKRTRYQGYTTDVFFREAITWMKQQADAKKPFFCYLPTAAPHRPLYVPAEYRQRMQETYDKVKDQLPNTIKTPEDLVRYLAMIKNIDDNVGRLETFLKDAGLRENTILVFLSDNGTTFGHLYYNAGMRGHKTELYEGGHRVPLFVRWPAGKLATRDVAGLTEVQDVLPTLLDLCNIQPQKAASFDGISLAPVLRGQKQPPEDRMLVINFSRMPFGSNNEFTKPNRAKIKPSQSAVLWKRWRLLTDNRLYNLENDPAQRKNVIAQHPQVVAKLRAHQAEWWTGVQAIANRLEPITVGSDHENPTHLSACEWVNVFVDQQKQVRQGELKFGRLRLDVARAGNYRFTLRRWPEESGLKLTDSVEATQVTDGILEPGVSLPIAGATLRIQDHPLLSAKTSPQDKKVEFTLPLQKGPTIAEATFTDAEGNPLVGAYYLSVERLKE